MIVEIARIGPEGRDYQGIEAASILEIGADEQTVPTGDVVYDLHAEAPGHELMVTGRVEVPVRCVCSRCARVFDSRVVEPAFAFDKAFRDPTEVVDLTDEIRESVLLAMPPYPLCREDCKGLCPVCGRDLNRDRCHCQAPVATPWDALDRIVPKKP